MTCEEIFSKIANTYVNGIMFHTDMVQYFDFLNLHGYKRLHEYSTLDICRDLNADNPIER